MLSFIWNTQDRYTELLNFEMEVMTILEKKIYELADDKQVPVIKNWLCRKGLQLLNHSQMKRKKNTRLQKNYFPHFAINSSHVIIE